MNLWLHEVHLANFPLEKYLQQFKDLDEQKRVNLIVSKNLDVMKNKAQFASKRGSVVFYVTKRVASWNAVLRAC